MLNVKMQIKKTIFYLNVIQVAKDISGIYENIIREKDHHLFLKIKMEILCVIWDLEILNTSNPEYLMKFS